MSISELEQTNGTHAIKDSVECVGKSWNQGRYHKHNCAIEFSNSVGKESFVNGTIEFHYNDNFPYVEISGISDVIEHTVFSCQYQIFQFVDSENILSIEGTSKSNVQYSIKLHLNKKLDIPSRTLI
jgi:hypothetical protein